MNKYLLVSVAGCMVFVGAVLSKAVEKDSHELQKQKNTEVKTYESCEVAKVNSVGDGFVFRCDIKGYPAVIGRDIPVMINNVAPPESVCKGPQPNKFYNQRLKTFLQEYFKRAKSKKIMLDKVQRGESFCLIADVTIDANSLSGVLIDAGLGKKHEGLWKQNSRADAAKAEADSPAVTGVTLLPVAVKGAVRKTSAAEVFIASKNGKVFHRPGCRGAKSISEANIVRFSSREQALATGRRPCKICNP